MLAFPVDGLKSGPCLLFSMKHEAASFKGFKIQVPADKFYDSSPSETIERQVVFVQRLIVVAETLEICN